MSVKQKLPEHGDGMDFLPPDRMKDWREMKSRKNEEILGIRQKNKLFKEVLY